MRRLIRLLLGLYSICGVLRICNCIPRGQRTWLDRWELRNAGMDPDCDTFGEALARGLYE